MDLPIRSVAARNVMLWKYRAASQSWVGRSELFPGNTPIPLYARVWRRSILPVKRNEMPRKRKNESVMTFRVFHTRINIVNATEIAANSNDAVEEEIILKTQEIETGKNKTRSSNLENIFRKNDRTEDGRDLFSTIRSGCSLTHHASFFLNSGNIVLSFCHYSLD
jgi:hypothetical protein